MSVKVKDKIQAEALVEARKEDRAIVLAATGVGKSKIAVDYSKELVLEKKNAKILIVVPTEKLRDENWLEEFEKWKAKTIWTKNVKRSCYVSINKIHDKEWDLVILDEVHNITENNAKFFEQNKVDKALGLTATPPENKEKKEILEELGFKIVYEVNLNKAVELGLVSPFDITVVEVRLDNTDKYIKSGSKDKPFYQTEKKKYDYLDSITRRLMFASDPKARASLKFKILERMRFIYNLRSKTRAAKWILDNIPQEERVIIFCGSIDQAEELCDKTFHSKKKDHKDFDDFKAEKINRLSCVNALNEGQNIPNIDIGVVAQLNSKELSLIQRIGRTIRFREGHRAQIYIVCAIDTQDEVWVKNALANFNQSSINYTRFENLVAKHGK